MAINNPNVKKALPQKTINVKTRFGSGQQFKKDITEWTRKWKNTLWTWLQTLEKFRTVEKNNYELAHQHLALGNFTDAIMRFRLVVWLNAKRSDAWYYLGCSYLAKKNKKSAKEAFAKALAIKSDYPEALYMLAVVAGKTLQPAKLPKRMPLILAREYFDAQAASYNHEQLEVAGYVGHTILSNAVRAQLVTGRMDHIILDLGVGTGLCASKLRDVAATITGVDISPKMLEIAVKIQDSNVSKTYDALINSDIESFVSDGLENRYDVIMAGLTLSYIGDIDIIYKHVARIVKLGGIFAFTVDIMQGEGYLFDTALARFRFSQTHIEKLAATYGLTQIKCAATEIFPGYKAWLCVFKK